jgi:hypothetical protein
MQGLIEWAENPGAVAPTFKDFWFNGKPQLPQPRLTIESVERVETSSGLLAEKSLPWNKAFEGKAVASAPTGHLTTVKLAGDMKVTVLGPGPTEMSELAKRRNREVAQEFGLLRELLAMPEASVASNKQPPAPTPLEIDTWAAMPWQHKDVGATNLSSITLLLEHGGRSALFTGDADPVVVTQAWQRPEDERGGKLRLHLLRLNHHGSRNNTSPELMRALRPQQVLVSSDGSCCGHCHLSHCMN